MVNNQLFSKRLQEIMDFYQLNASALADKLAIQRSSISHILSGRNKPSLDFVLKIINEFSEVDFYWLLLGKGTFPKSKFVEQKSIPFDETVLPKSEELPIPPPLLNQENSSPGRVEKIVFFYKDGTFSEYTPK